MVPRRDFEAAERCGRMRRKGLAGVGASVLAAVNMDHELGELTGIAGTLLPGAEPAPGPIQPSSQQPKEGRLCVERPSRAAAPVPRRDQRLMRSICIVFL